MKSWKLNYLWIALIHLLELSLTIFPQHMNMSYRERLFASVGVLDVSKWDYPSKGKCKLMG